MSHEGLLDESSLLRAACAITAIASCWTGKWI